MRIRMNVAAGKCIVCSLLLTLFLLPISLYAECQITLAWESNTPTPDGYRVYQRESGESYNYNIFTDVGSSTTCPISGLSDDTTYHFVVRAYVGSEESGDSNEANYTCSSGGGSNPPQQHASSSPPAQPMAVSPSDQAVDVSLRPTLSASAFIDHDAGDYHARTRWTIYRLSDDVRVLDTISSSALTSLKVPDSTLSSFTSYYWTACYYDQNGTASTPSQACDFTTLQASANTTNENPEDDPPASLSTSGSSGSGGGGGGGCFIQTMLGHQ